MIGGENYSETTVDKVINLYIHKDKLRDIRVDPLFMPFLVKSLVELNQFQTSFNYLQVVNANSLIISFLKTYCLANMS